METQRQVLGEIVAVTEAAGIPVWFFGSYALQALEGRPIRRHADIDLFTRFEDQEALRIAMASNGFRPAKTDPHRTKYEKSGVGIDCWTFRRLLDGTLVTDAGDGGIWPWPENSFPDEPNGALFGRPVRALSYEGQYVCKAGYYVFDPSRPLRDIDRYDLAIIRRRIPPDVREKLAALFEPLPGTRKRRPGEKQE